MKAAKTPKAKTQAKTPKEPPNAPQQTQDPPK